MRLKYLESKVFTPSELAELFLSVNWDSGNHPGRLARAMAGSDFVVSARDGERLVGLASVISDGAMNAYVPYLVVHPEYQGRGLGREFMARVLEHCQSLPRTALIAYAPAVPFYERCGFCPGRGKTPMFVTSLGT